MPQHIVPPIDCDLALHATVMLHGRMLFDMPRQCIRIIESLVALGAGMAWTLAVAFLMQSERGRAQERFITHATAVPCAVLIMF